jgi:hypothetical protein
VIPPNSPAIKLQKLQDSLAAWATILGFVLTVLGIAHSQAWLVLISLMLISISGAVMFYARTERGRIKMAIIKIEGRSIDSLNAANLRRAINRSLIVQSVEREVTVRDRDLRVTVHYQGYSSKQETKFDFSLDSDCIVPFADLDCVAFDLVLDPDRKHPITPILAGPDGISKKLAVPFLAPIGQQRPFDLVVSYSIRGCLAYGIDYYAATSSFAQDCIPKSSVRLAFVGSAPEWVRVYEVNGSGNVSLLKAISAARRDNGVTDYVDVSENRSARSARVYLFCRRAPRIRPNKSELELSSDLYTAA